MTPSQPQNPEAADLSQTSSEASPASEPEHFDHLLTAPEPEGLAGSEPGAPSTPTLSREDFHAVFCTGFSVASGVTGLKSLHVERGDQKAIDASGAIYETILEVPALHFLLQPGGKWMGRVMMVGAFALPMYFNTVREIQSRQPVKANAGAAAQQAPADLMKGFA